MASEATTQFDAHLEKTLVALEGAPTRPLSLEEKLGFVALQQGFQVEHLLGRGGMGAVVRARDEKLHRAVALKFLTISASHGAPPDMLRTEAKKMAQLKHPNVVQVYSFHEFADLAFFAMEYVEGESLSARVKRVPPLSLRELLRIMLEASAGVEAAHAQNLLHRDIKPDNIMIGTDGSVKVADFGIASTAEDRLQAEGSYISGTLGYMPPEQARGESGSTASDIYSLTATLYAALAGVSPYGKHRDSRVLLSLNQAGEIIPLKYAKKGLPDPIYRFVDRGLNRNPGQRFLDMKHYREELQRLLLIAEGGAHHSKTRRQARSLGRAVALPAAFVLGAAAGAAAMYFYMQDAMVARGAILAEAAPILERQEAFLRQRFAETNSGAEAAVLLDDLQKARNGRYWRNTLKVIDEIDRFEKGLEIP